MELELLLSITVSRFPIQLAVQQKKGGGGLLEELGFIWQEESWDSPETVGSEGARYNDSEFATPEFASVEELIQVVLRSAQVAGRGTRQKRNSADLAATRESVVRAFLNSRVIAIEKCHQLARTSISPTRT